MTKERRASRNDVSQETLERFKKAFIERCASERADTITATYDDLADMCGLSRGAVFKAVEALVDEGFLKKHTATSRRFPNQYELTGPTAVGNPISGMYFSSGKEFVDRYREVMDELEGLRKAHAELKAIVGSDNEVEVVTRHNLPGGLTQVIYRTPTSEDE